MSTSQGPKQPLEEKDAEIERMTARIVILEEVTSAASVYLTNSTPVNAVKLNDALRKAHEEKQGWTSSTRRAMNCRLLSK